jgi:hypothetical protein
MEQVGSIMDESTVTVVNCDCGLEVVLEGILTIGGKERAAGICSGCNSLHLDWQRPVRRLPTMAAC